MAGETQYGIDPLALIKREEGFAPRAKWDIRQYSGGYGSKAAPGETFTQEKADAYLRRDASGPMAWVEKNAPNATPGQKAALISFGYNLGEDDLDKLRPDIEAGNWERVGARMLAFNKALNERTGQLEPLPGLTERRKREAALVMGGELPANLVASVQSPTGSASRTSPSSSAPQEDKGMLNILSALGGNASLMAGLGKGLGMENMANAGGQNSVFGALGSLFGQGGGSGGQEGGGNANAVLAQNAMTAAAGSPEEEKEREKERQNGIQRKPVDLAALSKILQQRAQLGAGGGGFTGQNKGLGVG